MDVRVVWMSGLYGCQGCMDVRVSHTVVSVSQKITNILRVHQKKRIQKITVQATMTSMTPTT
jgi:hypothetical protein